MSIMLYMNYYSEQGVNKGPAATVSSMPEKLHINISLSLHNIILIVLYITLLQDSQISQMDF